VYERTGRKPLCGFLLLYIGYTEFPEFPETPERMLECVNVGI